MSWGLSCLDNGFQVPKKMPAMSHGRHFILFVLVPLVKREEEEIGGNPFARDTLRPTDAGTGAVADSAVALYLADAGTTTVAYCSVIVKSADTGTGAVTYGAVTVDLADAGAGTITYGAVAVESTHAGAAGIANGAITFDFSAAGAAAIVDRLRHCA